jgi:large subunit ribosomal protein L14
MIQSQTILKVADNSGGKVIKVISVRGNKKGGHYQKFARIGDIVTGSVQKAQPNSAIKEHQIVHLVVIRTRKELRRKDGTYIKFDDNAGVLININTKEPLGTRIFGPVARELRERGFTKIVSLAPEVL